VRNQAIVFNGAASADADGDVLTYQWSFDDGGTGTGRNPTHAFTALGPHTVTLVVSDGHDNSAPATTTVTITNQAPTAAAGPGQTVELGGSVTLSGAASTDPDQDPLTFEWRDGGGAVVGTSAVVTLSLPLGTHTFTLTVRDGQGGVGSDSVVVTVRDTTPPTLAVTAPQGVQLLTGVPAVVQWTAADNGSLAVFDAAFSSNGGVSYTPIPGCTGLGGAVRSCTWTSPGPATAQGRIRVTGGDASGNTSVATSSFTVADPALTVTSPNTAVNWGVGSSQVITWTSNVGPSAAVRVELSRDGGATWGTLASSVPNTGSFGWTATGPNTTSARVRVTWTGGAGASDTSNVNFTIAAPSLTVTAPNTRVTWTIGSVRAITWSHNLGASDSMRVEVSRNGGSTWTVVAASVPSGGETTGTFNWTVTGPATNQARVRVTWNANTAVNDRSDSNFVVQ
jgi:PKD repeat protein